MNWIKRNENVNSIKEVFLNNLGVSSTDDVNEWFKKSYANCYRIDKINEAVQLTNQFKDKKVTIVGDYDADGVTSTSILYLALTWAGFQDVNYRIPKRFSEGFGINPVIVDEIQEGLVIICDNGIAQIDAIKFAKKKGLTVIVIDHHLPVTENDKIMLPEADVIIDPNAIEGSADFNGYCGAGLCYRFALELLNKTSPIYKTQTYKLLGLACIGTVSDVMELVEENYVIVRNGIKCLINKDMSTVGCYTLFSECGISTRCTAKDIGFKIGPTINAVSRLNDDGAKDAVEVLIYNDYHNLTKAVEMVKSLLDCNEKRKLLTKEGIVKANEIIEKDNLAGNIPLVVMIPEIKEGIVGIIAGDLCEKYKVPVICLTNADEKTYKGSARSCGNYNIKEALDSVSYLLSEYGGHQGAAGLTIKANQFDVFVNEIKKTSSDYEFVSPSDLYYDLEITPDDVEETIAEMSKYEPFGQGNPAPVFKLTGLLPIPNKDGKYIQFLGADKETVKFASSKVSGIGFKMGTMLKDFNSKSVDLVGTLSDNVFRGKITHQIEFTDVK